MINVKSSLACRKFFIPFIILLTFWGHLSLTQAQDLHPQKDTPQILSSQIFDKFTTNLPAADADGALAYEEVSLDIALEGLKEFHKGNLHKFDPTAGDTCCQIRTHQTLNLYNKKEKFRLEELPQLISYLENNLQKIKEVRKQLTSVFDPKGNLKEKEAFKAMFKKSGPTDPVDAKRVTSAQSFLKIYDIEVPVISPDALYLIHSYFVTQFHSETPSILKAKKELLYARFTPYGKKITTKGLDGLMATARKTLSQSGFEHIEKLGDEMKEKHCVHDKGQTDSALSDDQRDEISHLQVLLKDVGVLGSFKSHSAYAGFHFILANLWENNIPLLVKSTVICPEHGLHKIDLFFVKAEQPFEYEMFQGDPATMMDKAVAIFEGVTDLAGNSSGQEFNVLGNTISQLYQDKSGFVDHQSCPHTQQLIKKINQNSFYQMVMANAAKHPQYVDKTKSIDFTKLESTVAEKEEAKFLSYCSHAEKEGLCFDNMSFLRLTHLYPSIAKHSYGKVKFDLDKETVDKIAEELKLLAPAAP